MTTREAYPQLVDALNDLRRRWRGQQVLVGGLLTVGGMALVLLALVLADNWLLHFDTLGRFLLALVLYGCLAVFLVAFVVRRWMEDRRDDFFAALVEQKHPELHNQLINALQLGRGNQNGFSPDLIDAMVLDAASATADLEMTSTLETRTLKNAGLFAGIAVVVIVLYAALFNERFSNGLARVLFPAGHIPPYTATQVVDESIQPGNKRFPEGSTITIEARVKGAIPATAILMRRTGSEGWQPATMQPDADADDTFRLALLQAHDAFEYYVSAGDGRSSAFHIEVVKNPQVESLALTYAPPAYTGAEPRRVADADGDISNLAGTNVRVELKATKPLKEACFITETGALIALQHGADDRTWRTSFVLWGKSLPVNPLVTSPVVLAPTRYRIRLTDTEDYNNPDPLWRSIALVPDRAPSVVIATPGRDVRVKPDATVDLTVEARDDYGIDKVRLLYRINNDKTVKELKQFEHPGDPQKQTSDTHSWVLSAGGLKGEDVVEYWAEVTDRNNLTGPGKGESRHYSLFVVTPEQVLAKVDVQIQDYIEQLTELVRRQRENRAQTYSGAAFQSLAERQTGIRVKTRQLARSMEKDALPVTTLVQALDELYAGLMVKAVQLLEGGRDTADAARATELRNQSLPVQDKIVEQLEALLARLQRNEQAKAALRKMEKKDKKGHGEITMALSQLIQDLDRLLKDQTELASKFERLPKKPGDEIKEEPVKGMKELEEFQKMWEKWAKGTVNELTKLPTGFVDDFKLRPDVNKIFEEIEKTATRPKAEKMEVSLEDLGAGLATKMKEDLETWMPDTPDAAKWVLEEPLDKKPMKIPEMPLPKALEDLVGDLLQKAEEFDEEADDITSAWGDNLDQAGWGVSDGPISTFSAKGKTGNDLPNNMELTGRSGEGRRGKSSGQMVGDTAKGLQGRKTPARVGNERYEPGQLKQEGQQDPNGATGGGKKAGAGRKGLQGGTPPDLTKDMGRLSAKQAGIREKSEQIANKLDQIQSNNPRLAKRIQLMKSAVKDMHDLRYDDDARKRRVSLDKFKAAFGKDVDSTAAQLRRARDLPPQLRTELLQAADEGYPAGYESLLKSYFKALSTAEK